MCIASATLGAATSVSAELEQGVHGSIDISLEGLRRRTEDDRRADTALARDEVMLRKLVQGAASGDTRNRVGFRQLLLGGDGGAEGTLAGENLVANLQEDLMIEGDGRRSVYRAPALAFRLHNPTPLIDRICGDSRPKRRRRIFVQRPL
jgi:hypothetical protein